MRMIMIVGLLGLSCFAFSTPNAPTPSEFEQLLELDYKTFDQTLPSGGWRGIVDDFDAARLLDAYYVQHYTTLLPYQRRVIVWHAGQMYATANLSKIAITRFTKAYSSDEEANDQFRWNAYVRGSIAFLEHNRADLQNAFDEMNAADPSVGNVNRDVLKGFMNCFGKSYAEAYGSCRPQGF
jgi:hypothetical protein